MLEITGKAENLDISAKFPNLEVKVDDAAKMLKDALTKVDGIDGSKPDEAISLSELKAGMEKVQSVSVPSK